MQTPNFSLRQTLQHSAVFNFILVFAISPTVAVDWEDQAVFRINKEEPHATKMPFATTEQALTQERLESPYARLLNGDWKFHWVPRPEERPVDFYNTDFDDSQWKTIPVPANVELQGYGTPIYTNSRYPFKRDAPRVMGEPDERWTAYEQRNAVSSYRHTFELPADWKGRQTFIVFNGVESAFYLWCNGQKVGYSQDSRTPAEFNLTPYLHEGENTIAVEVYRFSDGSYLEDQDYWRLSGIFRDVYLWSAADLDLRDFEIYAGLDESYDKGTLSVKTWTKDYTGENRPYEVEVELRDGEKTLANSVIKNQSNGAEDSIGQVSIDNLDVETWSAETPRLYDLLLTLKDSEGNTVAVYSRKVGFRTSEIKDGQLLVNGKPVLIKGVDRHDHNHLTGHYIPEEGMVADLNQMKRLNVNAIRTSHYPNDPRFLELCDEYGFYVVSEANIETHGYGRQNNPLPKDMSWLPAHLDRIRNNVELHKNHTCAVIWSLGNEAGDGPVFAKCMEWVQERDPSRPVQYENAHVSNYLPHTPTDLFAPMYYPIREVPKYLAREMEKAPAERKPIIQCEYSHAMGNSCGGLKEYWDINRSEPLAQGGFIWDWRDQGLLRTREVDGETKTYFAFGGDFGDVPNDGNFCMNGVVGADLTPNPHAYEVQHQYRNILTAAVNADDPSEITLSVTNENFFKNIEGTPYHWQLLEEGQAIAEGMGQLPSIAPQESASITVKTGVTPQDGNEYFLSIEYLQGADTYWAVDDFIVARDQIDLSEKEPWRDADSQAVPKSDPTIHEEGDTIQISGEGFEARLDRTTGQLTSYRVAGQEMLVEPLRLNFWRAPIDNDRGNGMPQRSAVWREAGDNATVNAVSVTQDGGVEFDLTIPAAETTARIAYAFSADGSVQVSVNVDPAGDLPELPRVGMQCQLPRDMDTWTWYGRGPWENYIDRNSGAYVAVHSGKVDQLGHPYSETQEYNNRTGVRWATFVNDEGSGVRFSTADDQLLEVGSYPYSQNDLDGEHRTYTVPQRDYLTVHVAHKQMGVGGENSWGERTLPKYTLPADQNYSYSFRLEPVSRHPEP